MSPEKLTDVLRIDAISCGGPLYSLDEIREKYLKVEDMGDNCWLCIDDSDELIVDFMLCQFAMSNGDGSDTRVTKVFHGSGPSGSLREPRHIWWGPNSDGYTFYLPASAVIKSLERLKEYFDFD